MSKPGTSPTAATFKPSLPIDLLPTDLAKIVSQAHPALVLAAFYFGFPALVADPVPILLQSILPLAIIQTVYAVLCLPAVGSGVKTVKKAKLNAPKKTAEPSSGNAFTVFIALALSLLSTLPLTALQILLGAPLTTHLPHTLLTSAHMALLAFFPLIYVHGADAKKWREIASVYAPLDEVFGASVGVFLGAWVGAVPIPLDWDREWQRWPVTIVTGAYLGFVVGKGLGGWVVKGKRIALS